MYKNRLTVFIVAALLIATTAAPTLAAGSSNASPAGALERVISFFDGLWKQAQESACLVGCDREAVDRAKEVQSPPMPGAPIDTSTRATTIADIFG